MVDRFYADTHLNVPDTKVGQSKPIKIVADNGKKYFLKTEIVNGDHQNAVFFQELLCSLLAKELEIPVPNFAIIEIEREFLENSPKLLFENRFKPGLYFATEEISGVEDNLSDTLELAMNVGIPRIRRAWNGFFKDVENIEDYANIIVFDLFIQNGDRFSNDGNLLVGLDQNDKRTVYAIDHGHAFGSPFYNQDKIVLLNNNIEENYSDWFLAQLLAMNNGLSFGAIFQGMQSNVDLTDDNPFKNIVYKIENVPDQILVDLLNQIPENWIIGDAGQLKQYLAFLTRQRELVRNIITKMVKSQLFINYTGGELRWIEPAKENEFGTL